MKPLSLQGGESLRYPSTITFKAGKNTMEEVELRLVLTQHPILGSSYDLKYVTVENQ